MKPATKCHQRTQLTFTPTSKASEETGGGAQEKACSAFQASGSARVPDKYCAFFGFSIWAHTNFSLLANGLVSINKL
jgi:hypothetical protein